MRSCGRAPGGCWPRRCRPRWTPTSRRIAAERDENGRRLVVRNGYHRAAGGADQRGRGGGDRAAGQRQAHRPGHRASGSGSPRRSCRRGRARPRRSPRCCRCCTCTACPVGDFVPALGQFLGSSAGLSAAVITRLTETWKAEQRAFAARDLSGVDYVYLWADGIHVNIRLEEHKLCLLVMIGVRADGRKELIALADGYRESAESWADLLRDCARRGHARPGAGRRRRGAGVLERAARGVPAGQGAAAAGSTRPRTCWPRCRSPRTRARRRPWRRSGAPRTSRTPSPR